MKYAASVGAPTLAGGMTNHPHARHRAREGDPADNGLPVVRTLTVMAFLLWPFFAAGLLALIVNLTGAHRIWLFFVLCSLMVAPYLVLLARQGARSRRPMSEDGYRISRAGVVATGLVTIVLLGIALASGGTGPWVGAATCLVMTEFWGSLLLGEYLRRQRQAVDA